MSVVDNTENNLESLNIASFHEHFVSFLFFEDRIAKGEDAVLTKERMIK